MLMNPFRQLLGTKGLLPLGSTPVDQLVDRIIQKIGFGSLCQNLIFFDCIHIRPPVPPDVLSTSTYIYAMTAPSINEQKLVMMGKSKRFHWQPFRQRQSRALRLRRCCLRSQHELCRVQRPLGLLRPSGRGSW